MVVYGQMCSLSNLPVGFSDHQYLWKKSIDILDLLHGDSHHVKVASEFTIFGWVWSDVPLAQSDCYNYQYLWKESIDILDLLHGDNHQGKVVFDTTTFSCV